MANESRDPDEIKLLWEYRDICINGFNSFVNFFVVAESVLLAVIGASFDSSISGSVIQIPIIVLGFAITLVWMYVQGKQRFIINIVRKQCEDYIPAYRVLRTNMRTATFWRVSNMWLLAYFLPGIFAATWLVLLALVLST